MPDNPYWAAAKAAYRINDRSWLLCTPEFFEDMLGVVPPVCFDHHPVFGCHFGVSEVWDHTPRGKAIHLIFRSSPLHACRMATLSEFHTECFATIPPGWKLLTPDEVSAVCEQQRPGDRDQWQSEDFKRGTERLALGAIYADSPFHIEGRGWFVPSNI